MILVLRLFLMIINNMSVNPHKLLHQCLFFGRILPTSNHIIELANHLKPVPEIILHSTSAWLIVITIKNLLKIHRSTTRSPISN
uniref:C5 protein n=1 Tax=Pepper leaf curl Yunnan virus TaxID=1003836 RepID=A0A1B1X4B0_9GEMI|nr:AC5 protein [Pepper leaf curl Yunnan virus]QIH13652.1 C5 protein [Pepper leaf curl Yunnan virus]QIH13660.1 C5 protein [Pepper leaf curl Yunnan virus]QIH13666.1 C5 protein [Pepper leaf curl Yunnan virus]QIH13676.1 C5 protein [Pepper leaf curl Yunnan virus]